MGCHGSDLQALRIAAACGELCDTDQGATFGFESPVPLFESGAAAAAHGIKDIDEPGHQA